MSRPLLSIVRSVRTIPSTSSAFSASTIRERKKKTSQPDPDPQPDEKPKRSKFTKVELPDRKDMQLRDLTYNTFAERFQALNPTQPLGRGDVDAALQRWLSKQRRPSSSAFGDRHNHHTTETQTRPAIEAEEYWEERGGSYHRIYNRPSAQPVEVDQDCEAVWF